MPSRVLSEAEYNAVKERVLRELPAGLSEEAFRRMSDSRMAGAIGEAENLTPEQLAAKNSSAGSRFGSGLWENLNPVTMFTSVTDAASHLPDTLANSARAHLALLSKSLEDAKAGRYSEAAGHGAAGLLPIFGPPAANAGNRAAQGDLAGAVGEGTALVAPFGVDAAITRGPEALARAVKTVAPETANGIANRLQTNAVNRLATELGPKVGPGKVKLTNSLAKVAPDLLRDPELGAFTKEGFAAKVASKLEDAKSAIDDANDTRLASQQVKTGPIVAALDDQISRLTASPAEGSRTIPAVENGTPTARPMGAAVEPAPNAAQIATLRQIKQEVQSLGPVAPYESVRRIREAWDKPATAKYLSSTAEDAVKSQGAATGAMKGTGALRDALAASDPSSAAAYRQYSIFKSANDVLAAAQEAERARPTVGRGLMRTGAGAVAGAASAGSAGAVVGAITGWVVDRAASYAPTMQITIARRLQAIADTLRSGDAGQAQAMAITLKASLPPEFAPVDAPVAPRGQAPPSTALRDQELLAKLGGRGANGP